MEHPANCPICGRWLSRVFVNRVGRYARDCPSCPYTHWEPKEKK